MIVKLSLAKVGINALFLQYLKIVKFKQSVLS